MFINNGTFKSEMNLIDNCTTIYMRSATGEDPLYTFEKHFEKIKHVHFKYSRGDVTKAVIDKKDSSLTGVKKGAFTVSVDGSRLPLLLYKNAYKRSIKVRQPNNVQDNKNFSSEIRDPDLFYPLQKQKPLTYLY